MKGRRLLQEETARGAHLACLHSPRRNVVRKHLRSEILFMSKPYFPTNFNSTIVLEGISFGSLRVTLPHHFHKQSNKSLASSSTSPSSSTRLSARLSSCTSPSSLYKQYKRRRVFSDGKWPACFLFLFFLLSRFNFTTLFIRPGHIEKNICTSFL